LLLYCLGAILKVTHPSHFYKQLKVRAQRK
jgi:hypothetical protein